MIEMDDRLGRACGEVSLSLLPRVVGKLRINDHRLKKMSVVCHEPKGEPSSPIFRSSQTLKAPGSSLAYVKKNLIFSCYIKIRSI
jgi:hypothetical protein